MDTEPFPLLSLPDELIIHIIALLDNVIDTIHCMTVNKRLHSIIVHSLGIQHGMLAKRHGVQDNPACDLPIADRYYLLQKREHNWLNLQPTLKRTVKVPTFPSGIYDLTAGHFLLGEHDRKGLRLLRLPQVGLPDDQNPLWSRIGLSRPTIDIGLALLEHDLCAVINVEYMRESTSSEILNVAYEVHFLQASSGAPHPEAKNASVRFHQYERSNTLFLRPSIFVEITGRTMILVMTEANEVVMPADNVWVFDWMTGVVLKHVMAPNGTYHGLILLSQDYFLLPNERYNTLEIWEIPPKNTSPDHPILTAALPELNNDVEILYTQSRCEPNPMTRLYPGGRGTQLPFHTSPESALMILNIHFSGMSFGQCKLTLFVHRHSLLDLLQSHTLMSTIHWDDWGPSVTRFLTSDETSTRWITTSCGQRAVVMPDISDPTPVEILDFNPYHLKALKEQSLGTTLGHPPDDLGSLNDSSASGQGIRWFEDLKEFDDRWEIFKNPVRCGLPYVRYDSGTKFYQYEGMLLDEDNLIGISTDLLRRVSALDIIQFI